MAWAKKCGYQGEDAEKDCGAEQEEEEEEEEEARGTAEAWPTNGGESRITMPSRRKGTA
jgi:hypothetical protein